MTDSRDRVADMRDAAALARRLMGGRKLDAFTSDETARYAVSYALVILGEAANHVPDQVKAHLSQIPWTYLTALRNGLVHGYFAIEPTVLYLVVNCDLPHLLRTLHNARGVRR
jgi:uncharacterized protein with HEPN domain